MAERRAALIDTARILFEQRAFDDVSTEDIARAAGVSQSLIFHYFPNKAELYAEALHASTDTLVARIATAITRSDNPLEQTVLGLHAYFDYVRTLGPRFAGVMRGEGSTAGGAAGDAVSSARARLIDLMRMQLVASVPADELPAPHLLRAGLYAWFGFVQELAIDWVTHADLQPDELVAASLRALLAALPTLHHNLQRHRTGELQARYAAVLGG